jgi:hypothetical protein
VYIELHAGAVRHACNGLGFRGVEDDAGTVADFIAAGDVDRNRIGKSIRPVRVDPLGKE